MLQFGSVKLFIYFINNLLQPIDIRPVSVLVLILNTNYAVVVRDYNLLLFISSNIILRKLNTKYNTLYKM